MPRITEAQPCEEWHWVWRAFMAWAAVELVGTATPSSRRTSAIGLRMTNTVWPASGLVPEKEEPSRSRRSMSCRTELAEAAVGMGGAAGLPAEAPPGAGDE